MKKSINIFMSAVAGLVLAGSCTNLDEHIFSQIASENYEFKDMDVEAMLSSVYENVHSVYTAMNGLTGIEEATDLWCVPSRLGIGWGKYYILLHKHTFSNGISHIRDFYSSSYAAITECNRMMEAEQIKANPVTYNQLRALRALMYYNLFDLLRNIPLDTQYDHPDGWMPVQAAPQETFDFIVKELTDLRGNCGDDNGYGVVNNATVNMLLAKMYLNYNAWFKKFGEAEDMSYYSKALAEADAVINSGLYSLASNYTDNFKDDISGSPEQILTFPFQYPYEYGLSFANLWLANSNRATYGFDSWATSGAGALSQFIESYDQDDQRLTDTWFWGQQVDAQGKEIPGCNYTIEFGDIDGAYEFEGARMRKYEIGTGSNGTYSDDLVIFRYADALMIKAECLLRLGQQEDLAADLVSQVRARNFKSNPAKAKVTAEQLKGGSCYKYGLRYNRNVQGKKDGVANEWITTDEGGDDIILGGLLDELAWEFVGECHRRQDLIRFKMTNGQNVYNGKSWFCKRAVKTVENIDDNVFPFHSTTLDGNPNLVQNPIRNVD
ncbi:MAG: RagB/SusD family nutrient uptake outer membrane protein [Bacteroidales bacterium]|nr:RagB/SusD family nutrient uptake outer membrane protein [Bacteroidales bacterium]